MSKIGGIGEPPVAENLPPVVLKNYGKWDTHEVVKPGVTKRIAESGDTCYTVRIAMPPSRVSVATMLEFCDFADQYCAGYFRITQRNSLEFVDVAPEKIDDLIAKLDAKGFPVGGTKNSLHNIVACPAWIHCNLPATDSPGIAKALGDALIDEFKNQRLPSWLKINLGACANIEEAHHRNDRASTFRIRRRGLRRMIAIHSPGVAFLREQYATDAASPRS